MQTSVDASFCSIRNQSETDSFCDLKEDQSADPILHGAEDQLSSVEDSARSSVKLRGMPRLWVYPKTTRMTITHAN